MLLYLVLGTVFLWGVAEILLGIGWILAAIAVAIYTPLQRVLRPRPQTAGKTPALARMDGPNKMDELGIPYLGDE